MRLGSVGGSDLDAEVDALEPVLFDAGFEPVITAKSPEGEQRHYSGELEQFLFWSEAGGP